MTHPLEQYIERFYFLGLRNSLGSSLSLTPELNTRKFEISGFLMLLVKLLRCQVIQR